jgi:hypothetical protein
MTLTSGGYSVIQLTTPAGEKIEKNILQTSSLYFFPFNSLYVEEEEERDSSRRGKNTWLT